MPEQLDFVAECEGWNVYRLMDGTTIRARLILTSCHKRDDTGPNGEPLYENRFQVIQDVTFAESRKREFDDVIREAAKRGGAVN